MDLIVRRASKTAIEQILEKGELDIMRDWAAFIPLNCLSAMYGLNTEYRAINELHQKLVCINRALFVLGGTGQRRNPNPNWKEKIKISKSVILNSGKLLSLINKLGLTGIQELLGGLRKKDGGISTPRPSFEKMPNAVGPMLDLLLMLCEALKKTKNIPEDSPLKKLIKAYQNGEATFVEVLTNSFFLFLVGYETSASLLSNGFSYLSEKPYLRDLIRQNPDFSDSLMDESMRFEAPHGRFLRRTIKNVIIGDHEIPAGSIVILLTAAANRDPSFFNNAEEFDTDRGNNNQHLSFGKGSHACIGASLARLQWKTAITDLANETNEIRINFEKSSAMITDRDIGIYRRQSLYAVVE
ncbi:MAG: cytochrome P450 [Bacteroidota bacterium]